MNGKWFHVPLNRTFGNRAFIAAGRYDLKYVHNIFVDKDIASDEFLYAEIVFHEQVHLHLSTSTSLGHAMQFLVHLPEVEFINSLLEVMNSVSFNAQEGAATLAQWYIKKLNSQSETIESYTKLMPSEYQTAFNAFLFLWSRVLPNEMFEWTPVFVGTGV